MGQVLDTCWTRQGQGQRLDEIGGFGLEMDTANWTGLIRVGQDFWCVGQGQRLDEFEGFGLEMDAANWTGVVKSWTRQGQGQCLDEIEGFGLEMDTANCSQKLDKIGTGLAFGRD